MFVKLVFLFGHTSVYIEKGSGRDNSDISNLSVGEGTPNAIARERVTLSHKQDPGGSDPDPTFKRKSDPGPNIKKIPPFTFFL